MKSTNSSQNVPAGGHDEPQVVNLQEGHTAAEPDRLPLEGQPKPASAEPNFVDPIEMLVEISRRHYEFGESFLSQRERLGEVEAVSLATKQFQLSAKASIDAERLRLKVGVEKYWAKIFVEKVFDKFLENFRAVVAKNVLWEKQQGARNHFENLMREIDFDALGKLAREEADPTRITRPNLEDVGQSKT